MIEPPSRCRITAYLSLVIVTRKLMTPYANERLCETRNLFNCETRTCLNSRFMKRAKNFTDTGRSFPTVVNSAYRIVVSKKLEGLLQAHWENMALLKIHVLYIRVETTILYASWLNTRRALQLKCIQVFFPACQLTRELQDGSLIKAQVPSDGSQAVKGKIILSRYLSATLDYHVRHFPVKGYKRKAALKFHYSISPIGNLTLLGSELVYFVFYRRSIGGLLLVNGTAMTCQSNL